MGALDLSPLQHDFYDRPTLRVAHELLGKTILSLSPRGKTAGLIVEVEAYLGRRDRAAHSYGGRRTPRNEAMYGPAGCAYIYFIYGMHYCFNIVTAPTGQPEAILVRAIEPVYGIELMRERRRCPATTPAWRIASGPANLCRAMGIELTLNGSDLSQTPLSICTGVKVPANRIAKSARIGIGFAQGDVEKPWRLFLKGHPSVSGPRHLNTFAANSNP